jgi:hypothetical protein
MAHNLQSPSNIASYLVILFVHLYVSFVNYNRATYLSLIPKGDIKIAAVPTLMLPQPPSQYTCHGDSVTGPLV